MPVSRLSWRIAFPFAAFVLVGSLALAFWMSWMSVNAERRRLEMLAKSSAELVQRMRLPPSERMAVELSEVLHVGVLFQMADRLVPAGTLEAHPQTAAAIIGIAPDGRSVTGVGAQHEAVKRPLADGWNLVLWRPQLWLWPRVLEPQSLLALAVFWIAALLLASTVVRGLVRPLRHLSARLPDIEKPGPMELPEASRPDEIGDLARAFLRTREALHSERTQREQSEKMAVLGRMTTALAHEIQNPVSAIKMHAQLAAMDEGHHGGNSVIVSEVNRIESLVNQWLFLSKPEPPVLSPLEVPLIIDKTLKAHQAQLSHAGVTAIAHASEGMVMGDGKRLQQVFSNLVMNAIQAMPEGGQLDVIVRSHNGSLDVVFVDTGHGFSEEALKRFSEFFFSEKEGGMGIGLNVATEIIKAHHGSLTVENRVHGGATVTVRLPAISS